MFTIILGFSALFVACCAAYFSVLGIASLFSGSFLQVAIMASSLELGKLVATSFLYRYWRQVTLLLKVYMLIAVFILMGVTSLGIFGYLSAAYQVNSTKFSQIDSQVALIEQQKANFDLEVSQLNARIDVLNKARTSQEQRLISMSRQSAAPVYADMERSSREIKEINGRIQSLQDNKVVKDSEIISLKQEYLKAKDVSTFKFVAQAVNKPLDSIVILFICILILVFDPLAVSLILAFNVASKKSIINTEQEYYVPVQHTTVVDDDVTENIAPTTLSSFNNEPEMKTIDETKKIKFEGITAV